MKRFHVLVVVNGLSLTADSTRAKAQPVRDARFGQANR